MDRKVGEVISIEDYGKKHLADFFEDSDKLNENDYIRGCYKPSDILGDCENTLVSITEAFEFLTRPELRVIMKDIYSEKYILSIESLAQALKKYQNWFLEEGK